MNLAAPYTFAGENLSSKFLFLFFSTSFKENKNKTLGSYC